MIHNWNERLQDDWDFTVDRIHETMTDERQDPGSDPEQENDRVHLPKLTTLFMMLGIFMTLSVLSLFAILDREPQGHDEIGGGLVAYGPADFPDIEFDIPAPQPAADGGLDGAYTMPPPPFSEDIFPCSDCHGDMDPNTTRRELEEFHEDIVLNHGPESRWCFDCHDPEDRDSLRLANGVKIGFDESYRLCGQCHGTIYRDWREGIHGRRQGNWDGPKTYLLCAHCHNPHAPRFPAIKPMPPRIRPDYLRDQHQESEE